MENNRFKSDEQSFLRLSQQREQVYNVSHALLDEPDPAPDEVIVSVMLWMSLPLSAAPAPLKTITPTRDLAAVVP